VTLLTPIIKRYALERHEGEGFGDFCDREILPKDATFHSVGINYSHSITYDFLYCARRRLCAECAAHPDLQQGRDAGLTAVFAQAFSRPVLGSEIFPPKARASAPLGVTRNWDGSPFPQTHFYSPHETKHPLETRRTRPCPTNPHQEEA
jgi:hypothetical protein